MFTIESLINEFAIGEAAPKAIANLLISIFPYQISKIVSSSTIEHL
ncbi:MAG: hypothetical protein F6K26_51105 [Moorea sp. SIO2I5]|nr:hypothetical protein [Moorena sp. SIO2I5]